MSSISYLFEKTELRCLMKLLGYGSVPEWSRQGKGDIVRHGAKRISDRTRGNHLCGAAHKTVRRRYGET